MQITTSPLWKGLLTALMIVGSPAYGQSSQIFRPPIIVDPPIIFIPPEPSISAINDQTINEDSSTGPLAFTVFDWQTAAGSLTVSGFSANRTLVPANGFSFGGSGGNRTVSIQPASGQSGQTQITIRVSDGVNFSDENFILTVNEVNDTPIVGGMDNQFTPEDTPIILTLFFGDEETPTSQLTVSAKSSNQDVVSDAKLFIVRGGSEIVIGPSFQPTRLGILPETNRFGSTEITISVSDGNTTGTATFTLTVGPVDDPPTISPIDDQVIDEDSSTPPLAFKIVDIDSPIEKLLVEGDTSNPDLVSRNGIVFGGNGGERTVTVTPNPNQSGLVTIRIRVGEVAGKVFAEEFFNVLVNPMGEPPIISKIPDQKIAEDTSTDALPFVYSDPDTPLADLVITTATSDPELVPPSGIRVFDSRQPVFSRLNEGAGTVVVTPAPNKFGSVKIGVIVSDGKLATVSEFNVDITPVNDGPKVSAIDDVVIDEDHSSSAIAFTVLDPDTPGNNITVSAVSDNQTLVPNTGILIGLNAENRMLVVTPAADQSGAAKITLTVSDGLASGVEEFLVTVNPINDPPVISAIADQTIDEDSSTKALPFTITDVDSPVAELTVSAKSSNTDLVPSTGILIGLTRESRTITVTPLGNQNGSTTISLTVSDGSATATEEFVVNVAAVNDPPVISAIADQTIDEDSSTGAISFTVADVDGPVLTVSANSSNPDLVLSSGILIGLNAEARTVMVTPLANQNGSTTISLTVSDGIATATEEFIVNVTPVNDAPIISAIADQTIDEDSSTGALPFTIADVDSPVENLTVSATSSNPNLVPTSGILIGLNRASRTITVMPLENQNGTTLITLIVSDGSTTSEEQFVANVTSINDPPVLSPIAAQVIGQYQDAIMVDFKVSDIDTPLESLAFEPAGNDVLLLPANLLNVGGVGENRTLRIARLGDVNGDTVVKLRVRDGQGGEDEKAFDVRILPVAELRLNIARQRDRVKVDWYSRVHLKYQLRAKNFVEEPWQNVGEARPGTGEFLEHIEGPEMPRYRLYILLVAPL